MAIELANHIYRDGEGVPVVLMNAYPVDHRMWDVCAKALADFADLIKQQNHFAPDNPYNGGIGYGDKKAPPIADLSNTSLALEGI